MEAVRILVGGSGVDDHPYQSLCLPFFNMISRFIPFAVAKKPKEFGGDLLIKLADRWSSQSIATSGDDIEIIKKLISMRVKVPKKGFKTARERGRWAMYELYNLSQF